MSTDKRTAGARTTNAPGMEKLLEQYGSGPIQLAGTDSAFYERHLVFDNVAALTAAGPRGVSPTNSAAMSRASSPRCATRC
jgi:hypothetical protein